MLLKLITTLLLLVSKGATNVNSESSALTNPSSVLNTEYNPFESALDPKYSHLYNNPRSSVSAEKSRPEDKSRDISKCYNTWVKIKGNHKYKGGKISKLRCTKVANICVMDVVLRDGSRFACDLILGRTKVTYYKEKRDVLGDIEVTWSDADEFDYLLDVYNQQLQQDRPAF